MGFDFHRLSQPRSVLRSASVARASHRDRTRTLRVPRTQARSTGPGNSSCIQLQHEPWLSSCGSYSDSVSFRVIRSQPEYAGRGQSPSPWPWRQSLSSENWNFSILTGMPFKLIFKLNSSLASVELQVECQSGWVSHWLRLAVRVAGPRSRLSRGPRQVFPQHVAERLMSQERRGGGRRGPRQGRPPPPAGRSGGPRQVPASRHRLPFLEWTTAAAAAAAARRRWGSSPPSLRPHQCPLWSHFPGPQPPHGLPVHCQSLYGRLGVLQALAPGQSQAAGRPGHDESPRGPEHLARAGPPEIIPRPRAPVAVTSALIDFYIMSRSSWW